MQRHNNTIYYASPDIELRKRQQISNVNSHQATTQIKRKLTSDDA